MNTKYEHDQILLNLEKKLYAMEEAYKGAIQQLIILRNQISKEVETDDLTHLLRKGFFHERLLQMLERAEVRKSTVNVIMMDLDHFKAINDRFGHQKGDEVLETISTLVKNYLRPQDIAGRFGGEEIIVAVECDEKIALEIAERIRKAIQQVQFTNKDTAFTVTSSMGLASSNTSGYHLTQLITDADSMLYEAKHKGRNNIQTMLKAA